MASTQNVDMIVVDRLPSILSIIDNDPVAFGQAFFFSTLLCNQHQMAQQLVGREKIKNRKLVIFMQKQTHCLDTKLPDMNQVESKGSL